MTRMKKQHCFPTRTMLIFSNATFYIGIFVLCFGLFSCSRTKETIQQSTSEYSADSLTNVHSLADIEKVLPENAKPIFGYRFIIEGDFDGDGKKENMVEHYYSRWNHQETNKYYSHIDDYDFLVSLTQKKRPYSFASSDNKNIDTLKFSDLDQVFGLSYLKNEGDLNGDGTDEISFVMDYADWSNINRCYIMTYKDGTWKELYSFEIRDFQLPALPEAVSDYGLFGTDGRQFVTKDSENKKLEKELMKFPGLVKNLGNHRIEIDYIDPEANMDKKIVNLDKFK